MKRLIALLLFPLCLGATIVFRVDPQPVTTTAGTAPPGGYPALYAVSGATISITTDAAGTLPATTYTDATGNTTCPINAPVVQASTSVCTTTTGNQGQFGFWLAIGTYYYRVIFPNGQTYGAFPITSNSQGVQSLIAGTGIGVSGATGNVTVTNTGVDSLVAGTGITISAGTGTVTVGNSGLISFSGGTGLSCSTTSGATSCTNTGILSVSASGGGLSCSTTSGATTCQNTGVVTVGGNSGVFCSTSAGAVTCSSTGVLSFNSRTGSVVPATNDYTYSQIGGATQGNTTKPQMAGTISGGAGTALCLDASGNDTTVACQPPGLPSGVGAQYFRLTPNVSAVQYSFAQTPQTYPVDYNWTVQQPGGTLTASTLASVTLAPCPSAPLNPGYLYISGGTGAAEAVLVVSSTCFNGASSGLIGFTPVNNHSGAWTIGSASQGLQEAINAASGNGGSVLVTQSTQLTGPVIIVSGVGSITCGSHAVLVYPVGIGVTNNIELLVINGGGPIEISNCVFGNGSADTSQAIHVGATTQAYGIRILNNEFNGQGVELDGGATVAGSGFFVTDNSFTYGAFLRIEGTGGVLTAATVIGNRFTNLQAGGSAAALPVNMVYLHNASDVRVIGNSIVTTSADTAATHGINVLQDVSALVSNITIEGNTIQQNTGGVIGISVVDSWGGSGGSGMSNVRIQNNAISSAGTSSYCLNVVGFGAGSPLTEINDILVQGNSFTSCPLGLIFEPYTGTLSNNDIRLAAVSATNYVTTTGSGTVLLYDNQVTNENPAYTFSTNTLIRDMTGNGTFSYTYINGIAVRNGSQVFCQDCNSTCTAGSSTGQVCYRVGGAWTH